MYNKAFNWTFDSYPEMVKTAGIVLHVSQLIVAIRRKTVSVRLTLLQWLSGAFG